MILSIFSYTHRLCAFSLPYQCLLFLLDFCYFCIDLQNTNQIFVICSENVLSEFVTCIVTHLYSHFTLIQSFEINKVLILIQLFLLSFHLISRIFMPYLIIKYKLQQYLFGSTSQSNENEKNRNKWDLIKVKSFCIAKETINKTKR